MFATLVLVAGIAIALLWCYRTECATWALEKAAADLPFEDADFRVIALELDSCEIEITRLSAPGWKVDKGRIIGTYDFWTLWENQTIDTIKCSGFDGMVDCDVAFQSSPNSNETTNSAVMDAIMESISAEIQNRRIPLGHFDLDQSTLHIIKGAQSETLALSAHFETKAQTLESASIEVKAPHNDGQITFTVLPENQVSLQVSSQFDAPTHSLDQWIPDWITLLGLASESSISVGSIEIDAAATGSLDDLSSILAHAQITVSRCDLKIADTQTKAAQIELNLQNDSSTQPEALSLSVMSGHIEHQVNGYRINANDLQLALTTAREDPLEWIDVSAQTTGEVFNESLNLHLVSEIDLSAGASVESPMESLTFECVLQPSLVEVKHQPVSPSQIEITGNANTVNVLIEALRLDSATPPYLTDTQLNITFIDPFSPSTATLQATVAAQSEWPTAPLLSTSELNLEATLKKVSPNAFELTALLANTPEQDTFQLAYADQLQLVGTPSIRLDASALGDGSEWQARLGIDLKDAELEAADIQLSGLQATFETKADQTLPVSTETLLEREALQSLLNDLEGSLTWEADALNWQAYELGWPAGEIALQDGEFRLSLEGSQLKTPLPVTPRRLNFELVTPLASWPKTTAQIRLDAQIDGNPLAITSTLKGDVSDTEAPWHFNAKWDPFELQYSDIVGRLIPEAVGLSVTGMISGAVNGRVDPSTWDGQLTTQITGGSIDLPASQINADGIEGTFVVDSLQAFTSQQPASNRLDIEHIQIGGLPVSNTHLAWSWLSSESIYLDTAQTSLFGGSLKLAPSAIKLSPFDIDSQIQVSELSLYELGQFFDLFDGKLEGAIEGVIPFTFSDNIFLPKSTKLQLPEQTQAKLHYVSESLKQSLATDSPALLKSLRLEPSTLITDALSDLTITEFRVTLFSRETPEVPLTIHIAGHGMSGKTEVPLILDIPIKGSLEELYILLLRLHTKAH